MFESTLVKTIEKPCLIRGRFNVSVWQTYDPVKVLIWSSSNVEYTEQEKIMKVVELREYKIKPGKTKEWLDWMREEIVPYQVSKGMNILDTYLRTDENGRDYFCLFTHLRAHETPEHLVCRLLLEKKKKKKK